MRRIFFLILILILSQTSFGNCPGDTLKMSASDLEALFLERNLELMAGQYDIDIADAAIIQARAWNNPTLSVNDVSFWSSKRQRDGETELIAPLWGGVGKNAQFSAELSQLVSLASKRSKLIAIELLNKEIAKQQFEELLRNMKLEFRKLVLEHTYAQRSKLLLEEQQDYLKYVISAYERQAKSGNVAQREVMRLRGALFETESSIVHINRELSTTDSRLRSLLYITPTGTLAILPDNYQFPVPTYLSLSDMIAVALNSRPDINIGKLNTSVQREQIRYEKAMRVPDLNISVNYDRAGGVWKDFVGVGIGMELPVFNRNKGAIKAAKLATEQSALLQNQYEQVVRNEVAEAYRNYTESFQFFFNDTNSRLLVEMENMLNSYLKNVVERNISMIEFLDFLETYHTNKEAWNNAEKQVYENYEMLRFNVGTDLINSEQ
ncbi:MAG: TolC family protein [Marinifilaceae bacterium]